MASSLYTLAYQRMIEEGVLDKQEAALFRSALTRPGAIYAGAQWYKANMPAFDEIDLPRDYWPRDGGSVSLPMLQIRRWLIS